MLSEALRLAGLGYRVFPCKAGEKVPATKNGFKDATVDPDVIRKWWTSNPEANLAIATEGLVVIDVDDAAGEWFCQNRERLAAAAGAIASTPRGGRHFYMRQPPGQTVRNSTSMLAESVDIRGDGGYILAAPSRTSAGVYVWETGLNCPVGELPVVSEWLLDHIESADRVNPVKRRTHSGGRGQAVGVGRIPQGQRNDALTRIAGSLRRQGHDGSSMLQHLLEANQMRCDPPLPEAEVERIARSIEQYPPGVASSPAVLGAHEGNGFPSAGKTRVVLGADEHRVVDETVAALSRDPDIYSRSEVLVRTVITPKGPGLVAGLCLMKLASATLRERLTAICDFVKITSQGEEKEAHPPIWLVQAIEARGVWPGVRPVAGIADAPFIRPDGSICQTPGYDDVTGVVLFMNREFGPVPENPTQTDAALAVLELEEVVCDFKFEAPEHRAAYLALVLTIAGRFAFHGPAPMFAIDANIRGAGKGLLAQTASLITTGEETPVSTYPSDQAELRKQITTAAINGDRIILLDNIDGRLGDGTLDRVLTCGIWRDRVLGTSQQVKLPMTSVWVATGNNLQIGADTARRIVHVRLDVLTEAPEDRSGFRHPDLVGWIKKERPRLHMACLTVLSAYIRAGCPSSGVPSLGSFEGWSNLIRNACMWVGLPDPCLTRRQLVEHGDSSHDVLSNLLEAFEKADPDNQGLVIADVVKRLWPAGEVVNALTEHEDLLKRALEELCPGNRTPKASVLGNKLRAFRKRVFKGRYLDTCKLAETSAGKRWKLFRVDESVK